MTTTKGSGDPHQEISNEALQKVQAQVNKDAQSRQAFAKDPSAVFAQHGIQLPPDKQQKLNEFVKQVTVNNREAAIAGIRGGAGRDVEVSVTVTVKF
jgi:hypothetical protein